MMKVSKVYTLASKKYKGHFYDFAVKEVVEGCEITSILPTKVMAELYLKENELEADFFVLELTIEDFDWNYDWNEVWGNEEF